MWYFDCQWYNYPLESKWSSLKQPYVVVYTTFHNEQYLYIFLKQLLVKINELQLFAFFFFSHGIVSLFSIYEFECPSGIFRPSLAT